MDWSKLAEADEATKQAVISSLAYHSTDCDFATVWSDDEPKPLDLEQQANQGRGRHVSQALGKLDRLPLEILYEILRHLDLESLLHFGVLNPTASEIVESLREYKLVRTHAPSALEALFRVRVASWFSIEKLFQVLKSPICSVCSCFGGFLYLLDCTRCCYRCLKQAPSLSVITVATAERCFALEPDVIKRVLPTLQTLPGDYSLSQKEYSSLRVVNGSSAERLGSSTHGDYQRMQGEALLRDILKTLHLGARYTRKYPGLVLELPTLAQFRERALGRSETDEEAVLRFMAATPMPYLDLATGKLQRGISCKGCHIGRPELHAPATAMTPQARRVLWARLDPVFSEEDFIKHCTDCVAAHQLWSLLQRRGPRICINHIDPGGLYLALLAQRF